MGAANNRRKGCQFERDLAILFRKLGWKYCKTSRYESKFLDDQKIDLAHTEPFQIQAKNTQRLGNAHAILKSMPQKNGNYNLLFHKLARSGTVVVMTQEDFVELLEMLIHNGVIKPS